MAINAQYTSFGLNAMTTTILKLMTIYNFKYKKNHPQQLTTDDQMITAGFPVLSGMSRVPPEPILWWGTFAPMKVETVINN